MELSRRFYYSPRQLYYYLHEITGMPIMTYIRQRKLINAEQEIALGRKMYDVAVDYGFETQAGFYKAFLQCIGCTPSEFQNHHKLRQLKQVGSKLLSVREELEEMNEIEIRKMVLSDSKSLWENIFSGNTPEEVKERVRENISKLCQECFRYAKQISCDYVLTSCRNNGTERFDQALGMEECGRIPGGILEP